VISDLVKVMLPIAVLAWLATVHRHWRAWPTLLIATVSSGVLSALLWYVLDAAASRI
jgi:hypothetical protein